MKKEFKAGIYENKFSGIRVKIMSQTQSRLKGWGEHTKVMYFTNLPSYGRHHFGLEGKSLLSFMRDFERVPIKKYRK